jgi:hypothetical protein
MKGMVELVGEEDCPLRRSVSQIVLEHGLPTTKDRSLNE